MAAQPVMALDLGFHGAGERDAINACAAQRSPLLVRQKQYQDLKRSQLAKAIGVGVSNGLMAFGTGVIGGMLGGAMFHPGTPGALPTAGLPMGTLGASVPTAGLASTAGIPNLSSALGMPIPGVTTDLLAGATGQLGGEPAKQPFANDQMRSLAAMSILVAISSSIEAYVQLKQQAAGGDLRRAALDIDSDASHQVPVGEEIAHVSANLATCREAQVAGLQTKFASAANDRDRKTLQRERVSVKDAIQKDVDVTTGLDAEEAGLAKTFTQGRAMAEGCSEADVLGRQAPAYEEVASTTKLSAPAAAGALPAFPPMVTVKRTAVRIAPKAGAAVLLNYPVGRVVHPKGRAQDDSSWWEVDIDGQSGFIRGADLGESRKGGAARPPTLAVPVNIRTYNGTVIAARTNGEDRLKSLLTEVQTG